MEFNRTESFDKTESNFSSVVMPSEMTALVGNCNPPVIAQGARLSYCNASSSNNGVSLSMLAFNHILNFEEEKGLLSVEAGITVGDVVKFLADKDWLLPVVPGYPAITIGGCIAFNVHGKGQYKTGNFIEWVEELVLYHPSRGEIVCSRSLNEAIFFLTLGGMGLTGVILSVTLRLKKKQGDAIEVKTFCTSSLHDSVKIMNECCETHDYVYSWNDFNSRGKSFGKGFVYVERYQNRSSPGKAIKYENRLSGLSKLPCLYNAFSIRVMCKLYYGVEKLRSPSRIVNWQEAAFPIYGKEVYFHMFGKKGLREYQVLFPLSTWEAAAEEMKELIFKKGIPITLASLKIFSGKSHNLSFSGEGVCITIDVVNNPANENFFDTLDNITVKYKGLVNLCKDSRVSCELVKQIFPEYSLFKKELNDFDPERIFASDLRNRLQL